MTPSSTPHLSIQDFESMEREPTWVNNASELKPGISYVCSSCGKLLYRINAQGAAKTNPVLQPVEVAARTGRCVSCGHMPSLEADLKAIRILTRRLVGLEDQA